MYNACIKETDRTYCEWFVMHSQMIRKSDAKTWSHWHSERVAYDLCTQFGLYSLNIRTHSQLSAGASFSVPRIFELLKILVADGIHLTPLLTQYIRNTYAIHTEYILYTFAVIRCYPLISVRSRYFHDNHNVSNPFLLHIRYTFVIILYIFAIICTLHGRASAIEFGFIRNMFAIHYYYIRNSY